MDYCTIFSKIYQNKEINRESLNNTELIFDRVLSLPIYPEFDNAAQRQVVNSVKAYFGSETN